MKPVFTALLPAIAILAAGFFVLRHQRSEITALENGASAGATPATAGGSVRKALPPETASSTASLSGPAVNAGEARAAAFLNGLHDKARPLIDKAEREAREARVRHKAGRAALLLGLSPAEADLLHGVLEKQEAPNLNAAARDWITQHRGEEAAAKYDAAETASRTAVVEHDAQEAIYRLSRIVDLTPEQKDRFYAGFVRKAADAPAMETAPHDLRIAFSLQDTPSIANPASLARPLLTPEQLTFFEAALEQEGKAIAESRHEVERQLMPALLGALQEAAAGEGE